tara:strand:- start:89518 stop:89661 length:144 start_codon:yes stop_codon:yes gene_type:complete
MLKVSSNFYSPKAVVVSKPNAMQIPNVYVGFLMEILSSLVRRHALDM